MSDDYEEPFPQNEEAAKRFKPSSKRKQPGPTAAYNTPYQQQPSPAPSPTSSTAQSLPQPHGSLSPPLPATSAGVTVSAASSTAPASVMLSSTIPTSSSPLLSTTSSLLSSSPSASSPSYSHSTSTASPIATATQPASNAPRIKSVDRPVYHHPISLQHEPLTLQQPIILNGHTAQPLLTNKSAGTGAQGTATQFGNTIAQTAPCASSNTASSTGTARPGTDTTATAYGAEPQVSSRNRSTGRMDVIQLSSTEMEQVAEVLTEATLSATSVHGLTPSDDEDDDILAPPRPSDQSYESLVPEELRVLPPEPVREQLVNLYYKNHYYCLPMVQRKVIEVCQKNTHIPYCLLLCNAVYYCGSMFSSDTTHLRKDQSDEGTVGEDFFLRAQALRATKYLTNHLCTVQALLLLAIGNKSPATRSGLVVQAITMALEMGLHLRMDNSVNRFMRAYRARIFWCCYIYDSTTSAIDGKPTVINDEEITVDHFQAGDLGPESEVFSDQYMLHCLRGWQICRRIRQNTKLILRKPRLPQATLLENLAQLDNDLVHWQEHLPKVFDFFPRKGAIVSDVSGMAAVAQLLCYALIIMLHYPYLPNPKSPEAFQAPQDPKQPDSQGYCTQAAKEITKIAGILLDECPHIFEQNSPARYSINFAIRVHLRNSKCVVDPALARESRRELQKSMDYLEKIENLQFFRINRGKKSEIADLLAACRAALTQHKSTLALAKEAAALKHSILLQEKQRQHQTQSMSAQNPLQ
ncbi:hypothetical protein BGW42_006011, partial [Actinomortierella wolfii]